MLALWLVSFNVVIKSNKSMTYSIIFIIILLMFVVSDRCSIGEMVDKSGQLLRSLALNHLQGCMNVITSLVPDDFHAIEVSFLSFEFFWLFFFF